MATRVPLGSLMACLFEHPSPNLDDHSGVFENGNEVVGLDQAPLGMVPTQESLEPRRLSSDEVEDRLVDEMVLAKGQRITQVHLEEVPILYCRVHFGFERNGAVLARRLRLVESDIGIAEKFACRLADARRNADAGGEREWSRGDGRQFEWDAEQFEQAFGHHLGADIHAAAVNQDDEFVATEASDAVAPAHSYLKALGDHLEQLVADLVPQVVVHVLEPVEIDEKGSYLNVCPPSPGQHLLGAVENQ